MIHFDLDGVIRNLYTKATGDNHRECNNWFCYKNDKGILDLIEENLLENLLDSEPTEFYDHIKNLPFISIITCQASHWRPLTTQWIYDHFDRDQVKIQFVRDAHQKLYLLREGDLLVEDYPYFRDYRQIVLIDYPYNRLIRHPYLRVEKPEELAAFLMEEYEWQKRKEVL